MNDKKMIEVKVFPSSSKERVIEKAEDEFEIYVKEPAQNNLANKRVLFILSQIFNSKDLQIISGARSRKKRIILNANKSK